MQAGTKTAARIAATISTVTLSIWTGAKLMLDQLGRVDVAAGLSNPEGLVAKAFTWLFQTPAWVPGGLAALLTFALIWSLRSHRGEVLSAPVSPDPSSETTDKDAALPSGAPRSNPQPYLGKAYIDPNPGRDSGVPEYHAIVARKGREAVVTLEYEQYLHAPGEHRWTKRTKVLLCELGRFQPDSWGLIHVPLMWKRELQDGAAKWFWGSEQASRTDCPIYQMHYRGRVTFQGADGIPEHSYFSLPRPPDDTPSSAVPKITDYYWTFGFIKEWEEDDASRA